MIDDFIKQFAYKNPHVWLQLNEDLFMLIEEFHKKEKEIMKKNIRRLIEKLNKK